MRALRQVIIASIAPFSNILFLYIVIVKSFFALLPFFV